MDIRLSQEALKMIKGSGVLYGMIADEVGVSPISLKDVLQNNDKRLTQAGVLKLIKRHNPGIKDKELVEEIQSA